MDDRESPSESAGSQREPKGAAEESFAGKVLAIACIMSAVSQAVQSPYILLATCLFLFWFFAIVWWSLDTFSKIVLCLPPLLILFLAATGRFSSSLVLGALRQGTFLSLFVVTISLIRVAALTSPFVHKCGQLIVHQPPGRRYFVLSLGAHLFGLLLNFAALSLLGSMVRSSTDIEEEGEQKRIAMVRRKRMTLAIIRGFATIAIWSPLSAILAILISLVPGTSLAGAIPKGLMIFVVFILLGWAVDRVSFPRRVLPDAERSFRATGIAFLGLLAIVVSIIAASAALAGLTGMTVVNSLLFVVPLAAMVWVYIQSAAQNTHDPVKRSLRRIGDEFPPALAELKAEVSIFFSYGMLAILILSLLRPESWSLFLAELHVSQTDILLFVFWGIVALAVLGVNPLLTVLLVASALPKVTTPQIDGVMLLMTLQFAWCTCIVLSPSTAAARLLAATTGVSSRMMCLNWNLGFALTWMILASLILVVMV